MACTLTIIFNTPGYANGTDTAAFSVPDGSYVSPYIVYRTDLGYNGTTNNVYTVYCDGNSGLRELATYYPGSIKVTIKSSSNNCVNNTLYDCLNGACTPNFTYNTPGLYNSLSACEIACGTGCSGKCVSNSDWAQIQGLSNQLKSRNCS